MDLITGLPEGSNGETVTAVAVDVFTEWLPPLWLISLVELWHSSSTSAWFANMAVRCGLDLIKEVNSVGILRSCLSSFRLRILSCSLTIFKPVGKLKWIIVLLRWD